MIYLLDTNVCIRYMNGRAPGVLQRLQALQPTDVVVCSIVKAELFYGAQRSTYPERSLATQHQFLQPYRSLPFDDAAAAIADLQEYDTAHVAATVDPSGQTYRLTGQRGVQIAAIMTAHAHS